MHESCSIFFNKSVFRKSFKEKSFDEKNNISSTHNQTYHTMSKMSVRSSKNNQTNSQIAKK